MDDEKRYQTHLFTMRLWVAENAEQNEEVRMQVTHVLSGETRYFRHWDEVMHFLLAMLACQQERPKCEFDA